MILEPIPKRVPICESDLVRVFDEPGSALYRMEVTAPDGTLCVFEGVRAYTETLEVDAQGRVSMSIRAKSTRIRTGKVLYPYHYLCDERVLCVLKLNRMRIKSDEGMGCFALNYNLFCLPWDVCLLATRDEGGGGGDVYVASRYEWERGELNAHNQEVQMFLQLGRERCVPIGMAKGFYRKEIVSWMERCESEMSRKR
jgi:hypothetical protein